jgi:hypothetical protein
MLPSLGDNLRLLSTTPALLLALLLFSGLLLGLGRQVPATGRVRKATPAAFTAMPVLSALAVCPSSTLQPRRSSRWQVAFCRVCCGS